MDAPELSLPDTTELRARELAESRRRYRYKPGGAMPGHVSVLPADEEVSPGTGRYIRLGLWRVALNQLVGRMTRWRDRGLSRYENLYYTLAAPANTMKAWDVDAYWAWSQLAGVDPLQIQLCAELPPTSGLGDGALQKAGCVATLAQELAKNRLYVTDYRCLRGIPRMQGRHATESIAYFWLDPKDELRALAIELEGEASKLVTPAGPRWDWALARAHVNNAANHVHQALHHLLDTHFLVELLGMSLHRNVSKRHPIAHLVQPHLSECLGINEKARELLLSTGGMVDRAMSLGAGGCQELIERAWATWRWDEHTLEGDLRRRGVADVSQLPDYPYRDDARLVHSALARWVSTVVQHIYPNDDQVAADVEIQGWVSELTSLDGCNVRGLAPISTRADLTSFLTESIFKATALHHAMNAGQHEAYGFVPYTPASLRRPADWAAGEGSEELMLETLPDREHSLSQVGSAFLLSRPAVNPLTRWPPSRFDQVTPLRAAFSEMQEEMVAVHREIERRNKTRPRPYEYMDPERISAHIHI
jgi:hypothetical protein